MTRNSAIRLTLAILLGLPMANTFAASSVDVQQPSSITPTSVLTSQTRKFLTSRGDKQAAVWVFFTDKGVKTPAEFSAAAQRVSLTERNHRRRVRTGAPLVTAADLPVREDYVGRVEAIGGELRRTSRWLNAASYEIPLRLVDSIAALPFVVRILPVAGFNGVKPSVDDTPRTAPRESALTGLSYGPSISQNLQINTPTAHRLGFSGKGVTLAITDSGFRKTHEAFANTIADGRLIAEYDFINNDENTDYDVGDPSNQISHGTMVWSTAAGYASGKVIGPGYGANIILCKTEDLQSETPIEEDNWVAALEFIDSVGADVINSSLGYSDWYGYADFDGQTAVTSIAASTCDSLGIVLCVSMGNEGPSTGSITAPADAFDVLSVGAVDLTGAIVSFSSRGPTYDGRTKPDVCALGLDAYTAYWSADNRYAYSAGTSFSSPLIAGAVCLLIEARPELSPAEIREAIRGTAEQAAAPDNEYGWGIANVGEALHWPVNFSADVVAGELPLTVQFSNDSWLEPQAIDWNFGDGSSSAELNPVHIYDQPGVYDVSVDLQTTIGDFSRSINRMIAVHADSLWMEVVDAVPGQYVKVAVYARNYLPLSTLEVPFSWAGDLGLTYSQFSTYGLRTQNFAIQNRISYDANGKRATILLDAGSGDTADELEPGVGPILNLYFLLPSDADYGSNPVAFTTYGNYDPSFVSGGYSYDPTVIDGAVVVQCCVGTVGNANGSDDEKPTIGDVITMIDHLFINMQPLECPAEADINRSGGANPTDADVDITDVSVLIDYLFAFRESFELPVCP